MKPPKESTAPSVDHPLAAQLRAALLALPVDVVGGGACEIVKRDGKTFGYVAFEAQPLCIYVSEGQGKLVQIPVESMSDVSKAMTALMRIDAAQPDSSTPGSQRPSRTNPGERPPDRPGGPELRTGASR